MKKTLSISLCLIVLMALAMWAPDASAFNFYSDATNDQGGCAQCHTGFRDNGNYFSFAEGVSWGDSLHNIHLNNTNIDSNCGNCHFGAGTAGRTVNLGSSETAADGVNAIACSGCHGRLEDANTVTTTGTGWGAGLRQHHFVNGETICLGCHEDSDPAAFTVAGEDVMPPFYGSVANDIVGTLLGSCNTAGEEQLAGDTIGLDNDGDNAYDTADPDCAQPAGPTLEIISQAVNANQPVTVPVNYIANGNLNNTVLFSVDFDETSLDFDPASTMGFPWPDAISVNPALSPFVFSIGITYDANDTDGELDFTFSDINPPLTALPDGDLVTITFTAGNPVATTDAPIVFSQDPTASFGNTDGESVPGTTIDGSVLITVICTPTGLPDDNCDGIDDDCNGTADDAYQPTQTFCGQGVCANTGLLECQSGQLVDTCVELPQDEATDVTCDGSDGDCDGAIDEDYIPVPTTCGVGECAGNTGADECQSGVIVDTCDPLAGATAEVCDNLDNDCDGSTDETLTRPTTCGVGECSGNTGEETCAAGTWGGDTCDPLAGAAAEICDNLDNDCDGSTDESLTRPTTCGVGECSGNTGEETCAAGTWGGDTCDPLAGATAEICDNLDNDCDGATDESLTRPTTCGVGECSGNTGEETCAAGTWGGDTCDPLAGATVEVCDNLDNDCDGPIDENLTRPTTCGVGECSGNTGEETCAAGAWGGDTCAPLAGATAEVCDNLDNDCDGSADENLTRTTTCGVGECSGNTGEETCSSGMWGNDTCDPFAGAVFEGPPGAPICGDTLDNDCDGQTDLADQGCQIICTPTGISESICNGDDDDCDGAVDEDYLSIPTSCGAGECAATGQTTCIAGAEGDTCTPGTPVAEVCDNLDNDCDGSTDENLTRATTCGVGECAGNTGAETCTAGTWGGDTCDPLAGALPEGPLGDVTCEDTLDNDCDGTTDAGDLDCASGGGSEKILYAMPSSGVNIANGIQTDHGSCSNDPSSSYVEELSTNLNDMCTTSYRYEQFSVGLHSEHYYNTAYVSNTTVTGVSYQFTIRDGGTFGIQLFYVISDGNRTYLGTEATRSNPGGSNNYTVDLSGQSGVVPAGAKLGLRTRLVSLSDTDTRVYLGNPDGRTGNISGTLIINESTGGGSSCPDGDNDGYAVCDGVCDPGGLLCGDCNDGDQLINPSGTEVCDDLDNDCDGATDENLTQPTTCGIGECAGNTGEETCSAGMWGNDTCDPFLGSLPEGPPGNATCGDTLDNDCDGLTDLADISCQEVLIDLDIERFRVSGSAKIGSEVKRIQLTVRNANGASQDGALATLIGVQNGQQVYSQSRFVFDLAGRGRSRFAFPPFTPTESGRIDWTLEIFDEDPDDDTATASTNVK